MGIKFLGTPIEQFDQLCREEEVVRITVSCCKQEKLWHHNSDVDGEGKKVGDTVEIEEVLTAQWG